MNLPITYILKWIYCQCDILTKTQCFHDINRLKGYMFLVPKHTEHQQYLKPFLTVIWKTRHQHLGIGIGIGIQI